MKSTKECCVHRALSLRLLAACCALPLLLAACGSDPAPASSTADSSNTSSPSTPSTTGTDTGSAVAGALPDVTGGFGESPSVTVPAGDPPTDLVVKTLDQGNGPKVESGDLLVVNYLGVRWNGGETFDSSFERGTPANFSIGTGAVIKGWDQGLVGQRVGSRVLLVLPPDFAYGDQPPGAPIVAGDTLVFAVDIIGSYSGTDSAKGIPTPTEDDGYPAVTVLPKKPRIIVPPGNAPPNLVAIPVITGDGPKVKSGDTVVVQYVGVLWRNGKQFDASWDRGAPFATEIGTGAVIKGWDQGLVGQTVGSRVLLIIPSKLGYGSQGSGDIKPGDDLVFAVDILGAY